MGGLGLSGSILHKKNGDNPLTDSNRHFTDSSSVHGTATRRLYVPLSSIKPLRTSLTPPQMISEVTPRGKEFLFFSLFSIIGKTSSFIGPFISSAIIDDTGNNSSPFYFLFALSLASFLFLLFFVDIKKSRIEQAEFLERERMAKEKLKGADSGSTL